MKKIAVVFFVSAFILVSAQDTTVFAQTTAEKPSTTRVWSCLSAASRQNGDKHTVELTGTCRSDNKQCYIVACATTSTGTQCSTGDTELNKQLGFGKNTIAFSTDTEPLLQTTDNNIHISASVPLDTTVYTFYAIGTQATNTDAHPSQICTPYHPAPGGRVFDSQSLEPLGNVQITLLDTSKKTVVKKDFKNSITSAANGAYTYAPLPGDYFLNPHPPLHYSFMNQAFIHPNAKKAYGPIYKPNQSLSVSTSSHIDIALNPGVNPPYRAEPQSLHYGTFQTGTRLLVAGVQTHPLTKIVFKQEETEIMTADADAYGYYEAPIPNNVINVELPIDVYFTKIDLTTDKQINTPQKIFTFDPYSPYIAGKAIDKKGNVIPRGVVSIILPSKAVYAYVTADDSGMFSSPPSSIPPIPYFLQIENPNTHQNQEFSISEFARLNKDYLTMKNINLMTATKDGSHLIIEPSPTIAQTNQQIETNLPGDNSNNQSDETSISKLALGLAVIFVVFIIGAGFYVYSSQKKKKLTSVLPLESVRRSGVVTSDETAPPPIS